MGLGGPCILSNSICSNFNTSWDWDFYKPVIDLAMRQRIPLLAANVSPQDARLVQFHQRAESVGVAGLGSAHELGFVQRGPPEGCCGTTGSWTPRRRPSSHPIAAPPAS